MLNKYRGYVIAAFAILLISTGICFAIYFLGAKLQPIGHLESDELYKRALALSNNWLLGQIIWMGIHVLLSIAPFVCAVITLHLECYDKQDHKDAVIFVSIISLSCMSLYYFLKPQMMIEMFRRAYETLRSALVTYESASEITLELKRKICDAIVEGEQLIGRAI